MKKNKNFLNIINFGLKLTRILQNFVYYINYINSKNKSIKYIISSATNTATIIRLVSQYVSLCTKYLNRLQIYIKIKY